MDNSKVLFKYEENACVDIDVKPGVEMVCFDSRKVSLKMVKKVFPDVKELHIGKKVEEVRINNSMFPNVRKVTSDSNLFTNGRCLVRKQPHWYGNELLNTFCLKEDESISLEDVREIGPYAFDGCMTTNITDTSGVVACSAAAFKDSAVENIPFKNGLRRIGNIIVDIDYDADEVIIPEDISVSAIVKNLKWCNIKNLVISDANIICKINDALPDGGMARKITISDPTMADISSIGIEEDVQWIGVINSDKFKSVDGIVYSSDMKTLIICPKWKNEDVVIPEGVFEIAEDAFKYSFIKSVKFPSTLRKIGTDAFYSCGCLEEVDFGSGIVDIGSVMNYRVFAYSGIKKVMLPKQVRTIGKNAFYNCSHVEMVSLNEGLDSVYTQAFYGCNIKEIAIPDSVSRIGYDAFNSVEKITANKYSSELINASKTIAENSSSLIEYKIGDKVAFIPRCSCLDYHDSSTDDILKSYFQDDTNCGKEDMYGLFTDGDIMNDREDLAVEMYKRDNNNFVAKKYITRHSSIIIRRMFNCNKSEDEIINFVRLGLMGKVISHEILEMAEKNNYTILAAYILDKINKSGEEAYKIENQFEV